MLFNITHLDHNVKETFSKLRGSDSVTFQWFQFAAIAFLKVSRLKDFVMNLQKFLESR